MENTTKTSVTEDLILKHDAFDIYTGGGHYINQFRLFHAYFGIIPNLKTIDSIIDSKLRDYIIKEMENEIQKEHYSQSYEYDTKKNDYSDYFVILKNNIVINLFHQNAYILFNPKQEKEAQELQNLFLRFQIKPTKTKEISLIVNSKNGLKTKDVVIKKPKLNIDLNYNDDFTRVHLSILKNIKKAHTQGLYLFHGLPGTGKSTYIKHLIHLQNKKVIFLSPNMAGNLDSMELTNFLLDNQNCILVIEDAEELILSRDNHHNSKLSFLLNLTDGLLGESLGIQIIATFNTDLKNIDKALLRKGRLTAIYEFKPLSTLKTNILLKKLGNEIEVSQPMSVADIFNLEVDTNYCPKLRKAVGFGN